MTINVVLADDHPIVLSGLVQLFADEPDMNVVAHCKNGAEALAAVAEHRPDVLVLDVLMPGKNGLDVLRELRARNDETPVALLTAAIEDDDVLKAIQLGVKGVVLKDMSGELILKCVRKVHAGGEWLEKDATGRALQKLLRRQENMEKIQAKLTPRETELAALVARGLRNREIAETLCRSEGTVKVHLHRIYDKLDLKGRVELARYAQESGLI